MKQILSVLMFLIVFSLARAESPTLKSLPESKDIFTIATYPTKLQPYFTPESLHEALPKFKPGEAEIKVGAKRYWQSGVIVLINKDVLFWTTCRTNFIHIQTPNGHVSFIIGDGKE